MWYRNEGQKYCRRLKGEHSAALFTCINELLVMKTYFGSSIEWPLKTDITVTCIVPQVADYYLEMLYRGL